METTATAQGSVTYTVNNGVATVEFFHPQSNSLPGSILTQLAETITRCGHDDNAKVVILKSAGEKVFCAGASFEELISIADFEAGKLFFSGFAKVINAARKCPKFIVCRVQGKAVGGGVGLVSATDYCYATANASVKLSELALAIGPFVVGPAVERKAGRAAFMQMAVNASEWHSAQWAKEKGLYCEVFDTAADMDNAINVLAGKLSLCSPEAMAELKRVFWEGTDHWDRLLSERAAVSGSLVLTDFAKRAIRTAKEAGKK